MEHPLYTHAIEATDRFWFWPHDSVARATLILAAVAVITILIQWVFRQCDAMQTRALRKLQYAASRSQMIEILRSYERYMDILETIPHHDIRAQLATARLFFQRAFSSDMAEAIPTEKREQIYLALITAHETLNATIAQQEMRDEIFAKLISDRKQAAEFEHELSVRGSRPAGDGSISELIALQHSPQAVDAEIYKKTSPEREARMNTVYPTIQNNAANAKNVLSNARALLGDQQGPYPGLMPISVP